jgi:hypothetical protein
MANVTNFIYIYIYMIQCSLNNAFRALKTLVVAHLLITVILIGVGGISLWF